MRNKVLFFTPSGVGGAERVTLTIAKLLPVDEFEVKVVFVSNDVGELEGFIPDSISCCHVKIRNIWDFTTQKMYQLIKQEKPYAVFCSLHYLWGRMLLASHLADPNIKTIVRSNIAYSRWNSKTIRLLAKLSVQWADILVMQTREMLEEFQSIFPMVANRMVAIDNPIDKDTIYKRLNQDGENPYDRSFVNYVSTCRIIPDKCIDDLLCAFAIVHREEKMSRLTILGKTDTDKVYFNKLKKIVERERLNESVSFVGLQTNPYKYVKYADCFVLPSRSEGFPNTLIEAMYLKTPVVATRSVPVVEEVVTPERGYVVAVGDVERLAESMLKSVGMVIKKDYIQNSESEFIKLFY